MTETSEYVVDTSVWIEYFRATEKGKVLKSIIETANLSTSTVAIAEIVDFFARNNTSYDEHIKFINERSLLLLPGPRLCALAGKLKVEHRKKHPKFGLMDGIHLATAIQQKAILLTTDTDFSGIKNVKVI